MRVLVREALDWHRPLMLFALTMVVTGLVSAFEYNVDSRVLVGVPIWSKPLQFSISFALYAVTLAWLISRLHRRRVRRFARRAGTVIAVSTGLEMLAIVMQVVRGQQSHFNYSSAFNASLFAGMGVFVTVIFVATIAVGVALLVEAPAANHTITRAVRCGLGISIVGMAVGFLMVIPRSSQGSDASIRGAHSVGVPDGGPSLPLVGWSTSGGDLRIPHFIGLHALQALPLLALAMTMLPAATRLTERTRGRLVFVGAAGYAGLFTVSLWQALRGQAITDADVWTLTTLAALLLVVVVAVVVILRTDTSLATPKPRNLRPTPDKAAVHVGRPD